MIYRWKVGPTPKAEAQDVGEEFERIRVYRNGRLDPRDVVEAAKSEASVLHSLFEWDDGVAAEKYRLDQARGTIRALEVVLEDTTIQAKPVRAFVSVVRDADRSYTSISHALSETELRRQVLEQALRELEAWRHRYAELVELAQVFAAIGQARGAVK